SSGFSLVSTMIFTLNFALDCVDRFSCCSLHYILCDSFLRGVGSRATHLWLHSSALVRRKPHHLQRTKCPPRRFSRHPPRSGALLCLPSLHRRTQPRSASIISPVTADHCLLLAPLLPRAQPSAVHG